MREADIVFRALAPQHRLDLRPRRRGGPELADDAVRRGIDAEGALEESGGLLAVSRAVHVVGHVAAALDAAHRKHLIHRDVKTANILLCPADDDDGEQVFLTDFGIAKSLDAARPSHPRTGLVVATFDYASPEQIEAQPLDPRSNVYSLGCVLYKLLTGSVPFPRGDDAGPGRGASRAAGPARHGPGAVATPGHRRRDRPGHGQGPGRPLPTCRALASAAAAAMNDYPEAPRPPYRAFLTRSGNGSGHGALVGPMRSDGMTEQEAARLVELVRRTRFDLPEQLADPGAFPAGHRKVTIEIGCTGRIHRVVADLDAPRRPPELDDLIATIERMPTALAPARPPQAPPTQRSLPPLPRRTPSPAKTPRPAGCPPPGRSSSRFAQPPPPLPPAAVPLPTGHQRAAGSDRRWSAPSRARPPNRTCGRCAPDRARPTPVDTPTRADATAGLHATAPAAGAALESAVGAGAATPRPDRAARRRHGARRGCRGDHLAAAQRGRR